MENKSGQIWFVDFTISILIFGFVLILYFNYTTNISQQDSIVINDLVSDSKTVSSSLLLGGFPDNWDVNNVIRIGFTEDNNRINNAKFSNFAQINYNKSKKLLGTSYDYFLFFVNGSGDPQNIEGYCATGNAAVNVTFDINTAYYYENRDSEQFLKSYMEDKFAATVYCDGSPKCDFLSFSEFISDINNYNFIVVEHPTWSTSNFNSFETIADPWISAGGLLFVGGQLPSANQHSAFGVEFNKKSGQSQSDRLSTVVNEDELVAFNIEDNIIFRQAYYIEDVSIGADLKDIARFNGTWIEFDDIKANGDIALARWPREEGKILFFSDFDATYLSGNFQDIVEKSAQKFANAKCLPINFSTINREKLVRTDRLVIYNSKLLKMVIYLWN